MANAQGIWPFKPRDPGFLAQGFWIFAQDFWFLAQTACAPAASSPLRQRPANAEVTKMIVEHVRKQKEFYVLVAKQTKVEQFKILRMGGDRKSEGAMQMLTSELTRCARSSDGTRSIRGNRREHRQRNEN
eukprot:127910-Pleurochrysis_carterae.AAC.10